MAIHEKLALFAIKETSKFYVNFKFYHLLCNATILVLNTIKIEKKQAKVTTVLISQLENEITWQLFPYECVSLINAM